MATEQIDYSQEFILVVDDDLHVREITKKLLEGLGFRSDSVPDGFAAIEKLGSEAYTILLTDIKMPGMDGMELIKRVSQDLPIVSIIAMTGFCEEYKYVDVINGGASDFIKKPFDLDELEAKIIRLAHERNLRNELKRLSITDSLTGLYNQRHFYARLNEEVKRARRQGHPLSLILLDLDNFKAFNDMYGHLSGDRILRSVGQIIQKNIRQGVDSGYRYGGDEFGMILIDSDLTIAEGIGRRIGQALVENGEVTASFGYALFSKDMSVESLISIADRNLFKDKAKNRKDINVR